MRKKKTVQKPYDVPMPDLSTIFNHSSCQEKLVQNRLHELHLEGEINTVWGRGGRGGGGRKLEPVNFQYPRKIASGLFGPTYHQVLATLQTDEH